MVRLLRAGDESGDHDGAAAFALAAIMVTGLVACAKKSDHAGFATAETRVSALIEAGRADDAGRLSELFGPGSDGSSPPATRSPTRPPARVSSRTTTRSTRSCPKATDSVTLQVGNDDWPFPVPVVRRDGKWYLDGAEGADEIVYRRIGRNELGAIAVCRGYVDAQHEYAAADHDGEGAGSSRTSS